MGYLQRVCAASLRQGWPLYLVVTGIFGLGVLLGSVSVASLQENQVAELHRYLQTFLSGVAEMHVDRAELARSALYDNLLAGACIYILGLTIICLPLVLAFIFIRGYVLGFTVGFLTGQELQGLLVIIMSMLPHNIFFVPALIIGGTASLSFSLLLLRRFYNSRTPVWPGFVSYTIIMAGVMVLFTAAAVTEAYVTPELARFSATLFSGW